MACVHKGCKMECYEGQGYIIDILAKRYINFFIHYFYSNFITFVILCIFQDSEKIAEKGGGKVFFFKGAFP